MDESVTDEERFRERQEAAAEATLSKRAAPSDVSGVIAAAALRGGSLSDTMKSVLRSYGKRKKLEMERYDTPVEQMRTRYETMRDWCQGVLEVTERHKDEPEDRREALDVLRATMFGARFDDIGKVGDRAVFPKRGILKIFCPECNDGGLVYKEIEYEYGNKIGVGLCHCGYGTQRLEVIETLGRKQPKKKRGEEF